MYAGVCSHAVWPASVLGGVSAKFGVELHASLSLRVFSLISERIYISWTRFATV